MSGFRQFPAPKAPAGKAGGKCPDPKCNGKLVDWDCGGAWGCSLCWVHFECDVCNKKTKGPSPTRPYPYNSPAPGALARTKCPFCGVWRKGMRDHIRAKHWGGKTSPAKSRAPQALHHAKLDCPDCGHPLILKESPYGLFYGCSRYGATGCKGSHSANADGTPMGIPADEKTRGLRKAAHNAFDPLWNGDETVFDSRSAAYHWMQQAMGLNVEDAHIAKFDGPTCVRLVEAIWASFGD